MGGCRNAGVALLFALGPWYAGDDSLGLTELLYRCWALVSAFRREVRVCLLAIQIGLCSESMLRPGVGTAAYRNAGSNLACGLL